MGPSGAAFAGGGGGAPLLFLILAWHFGQDTNWDLQNYHRYDAFALLHWRYGQDVAPAGPQTYLNPLPYLPPYLFHRLLGPLPGALAEAALQSSSGIALWLVSRRVCDGWPALLAMLAGATAAIAQSEIGTSLDDLLLAATPLLAVRLVIDGDATVARTALAGLLTGLSAGLKLTDITLTLALASAVAATAPHGRRMKAAITTTCGAAVGFLLTGGLWSAHLWLSFGNPFFPFLNDIFHAPAASASSFADPRYHFKGVAHALAIPFGVAEGQAPTAEIPFRDLRDLAGLLTAPIVLLLGRASRPTRFLAVYLLAGTAAWLLLCPIERYAVLLDMLDGAFVVLALATLARRKPARVLIAAAASLVLIATTRRADFSHRPWSSAFVAHPPSSIGQHSTELLLGFPLAYWLTAIPHPERALGFFPSLLNPGGKLDRRFDQSVADAADRLRTMALDINLDPTVRPELARHGLALAPPCRRAQRLVWVDTVFCRAIHPGPRADAASDLPTGQTIAFSASGTGWIYEVAGWDATESDGTWATGPHARLAFVDPDPRPLVAVITVSAVAGAPPRLLQIDAAGRPVERRIGPLGIDVTIPACLGPDREAGGVARIDATVDDVRSMAQRGLGPETRPLAFRMHRLVIRPARPGECSQASP